MRSSGAGRLRSAVAAAFAVASTMSSVGAQSSAAPVPSTSSAPNTTSAPSAPAAPVLPSSTGASSAGAIHASAHRTITTTSPEAQLAYDHGLILLYAFNIGAAREAFAHAAELDPNCAMAYYGEALTEITDINVDPDADALASGRTAAEHARTASEASPDERALIAAIARRFAPAKDDAAAQKAYESSMRAYANGHPGDVDGLVETAFAIWRAESDLKSATGSEIGTLLDRALAADPNQFGAHHLRIHFEEETGTPAAARSDAVFLAGAEYDLGESHLPHMAGHIFVRLGDYENVVSSNEAAIANDAAYFERETGPGVEYMRHYHNHDLDFVLYGLTTLGRNDEARAVAAKETAYARVNVGVRLHDWAAVLANATPEMRGQTALAQARLGQVAAARKTLAGTKGADAPSAFTTALVEAAIDRATGNDAAAMKIYQKEYRRRPTELGDPKIYWSTPIGETYGAALLRAGDAAGAEKVFSDELARYPNDPRLLFGRSVARDHLNDHAGAASDRASAAATWRGRAALKLDDLG